MVFWRSWAQVVLSLPALPLVEPLAPESARQSTAAAMVVLLIVEAIRAEEVVPQAPMEMVTLVPMETVLRVVMAARVTLAPAGRPAKEAGYTITPVK